MHTVLISFNITYQCLEEESDCEGGGLLVIDEDDITNGQFDRIVASDPVKAAASRDGNSTQIVNIVSISFSHSWGNKYALWCYGSQEHTLNVFNMAV
jgi:hypothetical protein